MPNATIKPIIIFGGTFDPIHNGHMQLAAKLYSTFKLPITFMPTGIPPHKAAPTASDAQRLAMLSLAIAGNPNYQIDTREIDVKDFCYTYKTLRQLRLEVGKETPIYFLIGGDSLLTLDTWHYWESLLGMVNFIVAWREGYSANNITSAKLAQIFRQRKTTDFTDLSTPSGKFYILDFTPENISSTAIRASVGQNHTINHLVPPAVSNYIQLEKLYRPACCLQKFDHREVERYEKIKNRLG